MRFFAFITRITVVFLSVLFRPFKVKRRIVFVSYFSQKPEGNLACALEYFKANTSEEIKTLFSAYGRGVKEKFLYALHTIKEVYYFSTSKLIVLEGNSFVLSSIKKKPGTTAVQLWHAAGAFKRFGADIKRLYEINGLDAAVVSCPEVKQIYSHALNVPIENVYAVGIPRTDILLTSGAVSKARADIEKIYPELAGKKIALYAPTFRGSGIDDVRSLAADIDSMTLGADDWMLAVRMHPMLKDTVKGKPDFSKVDLITALAAAEVLITDYSSIIFEYSALERPMIFYCPDRLEYTDERGFYFGFENFVPGNICDTGLQVAQTLKDQNFNLSAMRRFRERFLYKFDGYATDRVGELLMNMLNK